MNKVFDIYRGTLFRYNGRSSEITVPEGVRAIGDRAFTDCDFLKSVTIPEGVARIGDRAFMGCNAI